MEGFFKAIILLICLTASIANADNQTAELSPVLPETELPFRIAIEQVGFQLPQGVHSGVFGIYKGLWILIAGRTNGMHGFSNGGPTNFPIAAQNTSIYVINPLTGVVQSRSLSESSSGLTQQQIDTLSVTSPQWEQDGTTLYMTGGYGINTNTGTYDTKPVLTAINLPGIVDWVTNSRHTSVNQNIRQIYDPIFQITGGKMIKLGALTRLIFGQNFTGEYTDSSNGNYSEQVRQFEIKGVNGQLSVDIYPSKPQTPDVNFRRRDLNVMPVLLTRNNLLEYGFVAYAGVFTPSSGIWTVPVVMSDKGEPIMADPELPTTFKQPMNQYVCAAAGLYSRKHTSMYNIFFGGLSYGYYNNNGVFSTDPEIPFINQVTTIKMDKNKHFTQHLMTSEYPVILSTQVNPGSPLLFGAGAYFIPNNLVQYPNRVLSLDAIRKPTVIGYIVGGIASTLPNTNDIADSTASPYIFKVTLTPVA